MLPLSGISAAIAIFMAGSLSFLSPCILPIVPGYLSYLAGIHQEPKIALFRHWSLGKHALFYVLGFSLLLVSLGAGAGALGKSLIPYLPFLRLAAGIVLLIHGLTMLLEYAISWSWISWLSSLWTRSTPTKVKLLDASFGRSILAGMTFVCTPCVIPLFVSVLAFAVVQASVLQGVMLLSLYSLGLAIPFLLVDLRMDFARGVIRRLNPYTPALRVLGGLLLLGL